MPRDVKIRDSYQADVAYLSRLARAVEKDGKLSEPGKKRIVGQINSLMMLLLNVRFGKNAG